VGDRFVARPLIVSPVQAHRAELDEDQGMIDRHTAFMQEFCTTATAQGITEISARGEEKGVSFHMAPREA